MTDTVCQNDLYMPRLNLTSTFFFDFLLLVVFVFHASPPLCLRRRVMVQLVLIFQHQCMLGRRGADSGMPMQASTAWGTNNGRIRSAISIECNGSHTHQRVEGNNSKGFRSVQKAEWPRDTETAEMFKDNARTN